MKITSVYIENFGGLHQFSFYMEEDLTVLLKENGWGKSTLAAFITSMLYGLEGATRKRGLTRRLQYKPWNGGLYGGNMCFEVAGKNYRVERVFGDKASQDQFFLYDERTGNQSSDYSPCLGEELFGINEDVFFNTIYFSQQGTAIVEGEQLMVLLALGQQNDLEETDSYMKAKKRLTQGIKELKKTGGRGIIEEKREELCRLEDQLQVCNGQLMQVRGFREKQTVVSQQMEHYKKIIQEPVKAIPGGVLAFCGALLAMGIVLALWMSMWYISLSVLGGGLFVLLQTIHTNKKHQGRNAVEQLEALQEENARLSQQESDFQRLSIMSKELEEDASRVREQLEEALQRLQVLEITLDILKKAKTEMTLKYQNALTRYFSYYTQKLLGEKAKDARINQNFSPSCIEGGISREIGYYSRATKDMLWICARMAMIKALFEEERPFLLMDDPFTELDETHFFLAKGFLEEISKEYQILYLTCHRSRC